MGKLTSSLGQVCIFPEHSSKFSEAQLIEHNSVRSPSLGLISPLSPCFSSRCLCNGSWCQHTVILQVPQTDLCLSAMADLSLRQGSYDFFCNWINNCPNTLDKQSFWHWSEVSHLLYMNFPYAHEVVCRLSFLFHQPIGCFSMNLCNTVSSPLGNSLSRFSFIFFNKNIQFSSQVLCIFVMVFKNKLHVTDFQHSKQDYQWLQPVQ